MLNYPIKIFSILTVSIVFVFSINTFAQFIDQSTLSDVSNTDEHPGYKPQSKVWKYNGFWWTAIPIKNDGTYLYRLDGNSWTKLIKLTDHTDVHADAKAVGDITHILFVRSSSSDFVSIQYVPSSNNYQFWSGRNPNLVSINLGSGVETATIDIDSNGKIWLAADNAPSIDVRWSVSPYSSWSSAITINSGHNIDSDDICSVTAFDGNKIGVLWSNQKDKKFQFKYHLDNNNNTTWSNLEIASGSASGSVADDHINFAVGTDGTLYAAIKTSYDKSSEITIGLLVRKNSNWNLYGVTNGGGTRPIALLDESNHKIYVIYARSESDGNIVYNYSSTSNISFSSQHTLDQGSFNNVTSTKQNFTNDVVVLYENGSSWSGVMAGTQSLPVELVSFSGALNGTEIKLTWRTDNEVNNYGFNIENSINNGDWSNIGFIEGYGNSNSPKYYDFSDGNINSAGEYHYRLKQVDNDGTFEYSDVITVLVSTPINFYLSQNYPNPFNPSTKIDFSLPEKQMVSLRVYNTLGEMVSELVNEVREPGSYSVTFDASNLPSGVYIYRIQTPSFAANNKMTFLK